MATAAARSRAVERIARTCEQGLDATSLRVEVLEELRRAVGFDAFVWVLTDPHTCVGAAPLADVPCLSELPRLIRLKYLTTLNRWTVLRRGQVGLLHADTRGDRAQSLVWREMLSSYGVADVMSCVFRDRFGCWGFLDLWRTEPSAAFSGSDAQLLAAVTDALTTAQRRAQAATFGMRSTHEPALPGAAVLLLAPTLEVRAQTPETRAYLARLLPPEDGLPPIPAVAFNAAAQLLANEAGVDDQPPSTRVHLVQGQWLTLRAARIGDAAQPRDRDIAVTIEQTSSADRVSVFAVAFGMSRREVEVLHHLAAGHDTRGIATALVISEHTVYDHLKSLSAKTGLRTRAALVSAALGTPAAAPR